MSSRSTEPAPRILFTAVEEMDRLANQFRHRLREVAVELSREAARTAPIGPDTVFEAVPLVCRELLSGQHFKSGDESDSDGQRQEAA